MKNYIKILYRQYISRSIKRKWERELSEEIMSNINLAHWKQKCKGDTFFILGTGSSINEISSDRWSKISEETTMGINFWMIHDFVPDFYVAEIPGENRGKMWTDIINERLADYRKAGVWINVKVPYAKSKNTSEKLETIKLLPLDVFNEVNLIPSFPIYTNEKRDVLSNVSKYIDYCIKTDTLKFVAQMRGSILGAYLIGVVLGFKKIVFCGIDLNDTKYFYTEREDYYKAKNRTVPGTGYAVGAVHGNIKKVDNALDVIELIELLDIYFRKEYKVKTYNINPKSRLAEILPLYEE